MAVRLEAPKQGTIAATAAVVLLAGCFAAPVLAAPDRFACSDDRSATLDVASHELVLTSHEVSGDEASESVAATIDSVADDHLLKPGVEAAARKVFAEDSAARDTEEAASESDEVAKARLRRVSDNHPVPFRRQMYRRDI